MQILSRSMALPKRPLLVMILSTATLVRCDCGDEESFVASATISPAALSFGEVAVDQRRTLPISFLSDGSASYRIEALNLDGDDETFIVSPDPVLLDTGIPLGQTATISVTYVPCPDAWDGDQLREGFDTSTCPTALLAATLNVTDNTPEQAKSIRISGTPVLPPSSSLVCPSGQAACGDADPSLGPCQGLTFGQVNAGDEPCDILLELRNTWRDGAPVGELVIEDAQLIIENIDTDMLFQGEEIGFQLLDANRQPLRVSAEQPIRVPIAPGTEEGAVQFWVRYSGAVPGTWRGERANDTGLRLRTNDPDNPVLTAPVSAVGSAADITIFPNFYNYEEVGVGTTATTTIAVRNDGNATLTISNMEIRSGSTEFTWTTNRGETFPITLDILRSLELYVTYAPSDAGFDVEFLDVTSTDPDEGVFQIELRGGAQPTAAFEPPTTLVFEIDDPPAPTTDRSIRVCNVGGADLTVSQLDLEPVDNEGTALDDFSILTPTGCGTFPCSVDIVLCPADDDGDMTNCPEPCTDIVVRYANNDQSSVDEVNLIITSDDPGDMNHRIALRANDVPCRFPQPAFEVLTADPCAMQPVTVSGATSLPNGRVGQNDMITTYRWSWLFSRRPVPTFMPPDGETMTFIPERSGNYILGLDVQNSCGQGSQTAATQTIPVRDACD